MPSPHARKITSDSAQAIKTGKRFDSNGGRCDNVRCKKPQTCMTSKGQERRIGAVRNISALPRRADVGADIVEPPVSANFANSGREQMQQLFDHLVSAGEDAGRKLDTYRLCGVEVHHQLEFRSLLDREVLGLGAFENFFHIVSTAAVHGREIDAIGHEPAHLDVAPVDEHGRHSMLKRQFGDLAMVRNEQGTGQDEHRLRPARSCTIE
jgi:hypothetical protein